MYETLPTPEYQTKNQLVSPLEILAEAASPVVTLTASYQVALASLKMIKLVASGVVNATVNGSVALL